jgi:hypothetical protein
MSRGISPSIQNELSILKIYTEYKLNGSLQQLLNSMSCSDINNLLQLQREFLTNLTIKTLNFELDNIIAEEELAKSKYHEPSQNKEFAKLLKEYSKLSTTRLQYRILGFILYILWSFTRNKERKDLFATFVFHKKPPKTILNVVITLLFIYDSETLARKILKEIFPWITFDAPARSLQRLFFLWQSAEQSVKL